MLFIFSNVDTDELCGKLFNILISTESICVAVGINRVGRGTERLLEVN